MVFVNTNYWSDQAFNYGKAPANFSSADKLAGTNLLEKQLTGYTFVTLRSIGDQPAQHAPCYLAEWQTLPAGSFIPGWKLRPRAQFQTVAGMDVHGFDITNTIPFPLASTAPSAIVPQPYAALPYVAFDYLGRLVSGTDEYIPLAQGSVVPARDSTHALQMGPADVLETPPGNSVLAYNLIQIDALTGRARLLHQEIQP